MLLLHDFGAKHCVDLYFHTSFQTKQDDFQYAFTKDKCVSDMGLVQSSKEVLNEVLNWYLSFRAVFNWMASNKTKATRKGQLQQRKTAHSTGENNHVTGKIGFCLAADSPLSLVPKVKCEVLQYGVLWTDLPLCFTQSAVIYSRVHCYYLALFYSSRPKHWTWKREDSWVFLKQFVSWPIINMQVVNRKHSNWKNPSALSAVERGVFVILKCNRAMINW